MDSKDNWEDYQVFLFSIMDIYKIHCISKNNSITLVLSGKRDTHHPCEKSAIQTDSKQLKLRVPFTKNCLLVIHHWSRENSWTKLLWFRVAEILFWCYIKSDLINLGKFSSNCKNSSWHKLSQCNNISFSDVIINLLVPLSCSIPLDQICYGAKSLSNTDHHIVLIEHLIHNLAFHLLI